MLMQFSGCGKGPGEPSLLWERTTGAFTFAALPLCLQSGLSLVLPGEPSAPWTHGQVEAGTKPALLVEQTS